MKPDYEDVFDRKRLGAAIAARLHTEEPCLIALAHDEAEEQLMSDYDLASCVTSRFGIDLDPAVFRDAELLEHWLGVALDDGESLGKHFDLGQYRYWIVQDGERVGKMGYWVRESGDETMLELTSVYVRPKFRRQGWASRMLHRIKDLAFELGVARMQVYCHWGNQNALRFYLAQGMWVQSWKRSIRLFIDRGDPPLRTHMEGTRATFLVEDRAVGIAQNYGHRLGWRLGDGLDWARSFQVEATASVLLALADWPIIRSDEEWQKQVRSGVADAGSFESLALRVRRFERHLRNRGWKTPAPNPSFATLPTLLAVHELTDRFEVRLSTGDVYPLPFELLDPMPSTEDPVVDLSHDGEEIRYRLRCGEAGSWDVDSILSC